MLRFRASAVRDALDGYVHRSPAEGRYVTRKLRPVAAPRPVPAPAPAPARREALARPLAWSRVLAEAFWMWLATRVALAVFTVAVVLIAPGARERGLAQVSPRTLLYAWKQWDGYWYIEIAHLGYWNPKSTAFFPLYPLLIRATSFVVGQHWLLVAMLISNLAALGAFAGVALLAANEHGGGLRAADRVLLVFAAYPLAFFLAAPYTEGLFVAFAAFTLLFARRAMWRLAALTAFLAALTRPTSVVLFLPLIWEFGRVHGWWKAAGETLMSLRRQGWSRLAELRTAAGTQRARAWAALRARGPLGALPWRPALNAALIVAAIPAGFGFYMSYLWLRYHHPLLFLHAQRYYWGRVDMPLWVSIPQAIKQFLSLPFLSYYQARDLVDYVPLVLFALITLLMIRRQPFAFTLYTAGLLYLAVASPIVGTHDPEMFQSAGRFLLAAVPVFLALGAWTRRRPALAMLLIGGGFMLQAALAAYYLTGGWLT